MGGIVIGGGSRRRRDQRPVTDQLCQSLAPVDRYLQPRRLRARPQQGNLIDRQGLMDGPIAVHCSHRQRVDNFFLCRLKPGKQTILMVFIHQKPNCAPVHTIDGQGQINRLVQGFQHKAVPAKRHNHIGIFRLRIAVQFYQAVTGRLRHGGITGQEGDSHCHKTLFPE